MMATALTLNALPRSVVIVKAKAGDKLNGNSWPTGLGVEQRSVIA